MLAKIWSNACLARRCGSSRAAVDRRAKILCVEPASRYKPKVLTAMIKATWVCEQAHQRSKRSLGSITSKADLGQVYINMP